MAHSAQIVGHESRQLGCEVARGEKWWEADLDESMLRALALGFLASVLPVFPVTSDGLDGVFALVVPLLEGGPLD